MIEDSLPGSVKILRHSWDYDMQHAVAIRWHSLNCVYEYLFNVHGITKEVRDTMDKQAIRSLTQWFWRKIGAY